jgi:hypothetical protein
MSKFVVAVLLSITSLSSFAQTDVDRRLYEVDRYLHNNRGYNPPSHYNPSYPNPTSIGGSGHRCPPHCNYPGVAVYPQPHPYLGNGGVRVQIGVQGSRGGVWISN